MSKKKKGSGCDLHTDPKTRPNAVSLPKRILNMLTKTEEDRLFAKYLLSSEGEFRLRHPMVIDAIWNLVKDDVIADLKKYDEECGDADDNGCTGGSCDKD